MAPGATRLTPSSSLGASPTRTVAAAVAGNGRTVEVLGGVVLVLVLVVLVLVMWNESVPCAGVVG